MFSNTCVQIFMKVQPTEFQDIVVFIKKRLSAKTKEYQLFRHLCTCYPDFTADNLDSGMLIELLFKKKKLSNPPKSLSNVGNLLTRVMEEYLLERCLKNNPQEKELLLAQEYSRLGLQDLLDKRIESYFPAPKKEAKKGKNTAQEEEATKVGSSKKLYVWHHWHLYRLYHLRYYSRETVQTDSNEASLYKSMEQLDLAYLSIKLRVVHEMESMKRLNGKVPTVAISAEELQKLEDNLSALNPYLKLYYYAYALLFHPGDDRYQQLKQLLAKLGHQLSKDERGNLLRALINYASMAIRQGDHTYYAESAELHQQGLETGVLLQDDKISPELLVNVLNITCEANKVDEADALLQKWIPFLPQNLKEETVAVLNGRLYFFKRKFEKGFRQFAEVKRYSNRLMELCARTTTVQCYYEANMDDLLLPFCEAFSKSLSRSEERFSDDHRESFGNFVKMVVALSKGRTNPNSKLDSSKLHSKLAEYKLMVCKNWLLEKINDFN